MKLPHENKRWSPAEDQIIRDHYLSKDARSRLATMLPDRTWKAVREHANRRLGLLARRPWSSAEVARLVELFGVKTLDELEPILGRNVIAISRKAVSLGLRAGLIRQGYESIKAAAERHGVSDLLVSNAIRYAKLHPHHLTASADHKTVRRKSKRYHYDASDLEEAIQEYMALETLESASKRLGVYSRTLRKWMTAAGVPPRRFPGHRAFCQYKKEDVDRVFWLHQNAETAAYAARRIGMAIDAFTRRLKRIGAPPKTGHYWMVDPATTDRIALLWPGRLSGKADTHGASEAAE